MHYLCHVQILGATLSEANLNLQSYREQIVGWKYFECYWTRNMSLHIPIPPPRNSLTTVKIEQLSSNSNEGWLTHRDRTNKASVGFMSHSVCNNSILFLPVVVSSSCFSPVLTKFWHTAKYEQGSTITVCAKDLDCYIIE